MVIQHEISPRMLNNAEYILISIAEGKPGDTVTIISDDLSYVSAHVLADVAKNLGMNPMIIDVDMYRERDRPEDLGRPSGYSKFPKHGEKTTFGPLKAAVCASDICFTTCNLTFWQILSHDEGEKALTGESRRFLLETRGMAEWAFDHQEALVARERTQKLAAILRKAKLLHVTTALGTDFTCPIGVGNTDGIHEVMAFVPFFNEVAIVPGRGRVNGLLVVDGASQFYRKEKNGVFSNYPIRPNTLGSRELHKEPLRIRLEDGRAVGFSGDTAQVERLSDYIECNTPHANIVDEVGLVTATVKENDYYGWLHNGTHQTNTVHVALGNNDGREAVIHAKAHVDFDMRNPIIEIDGITIYKDRKFNDDFILRERK